MPGCSAPGTSSSGRAFYIDPASGSSSGDGSASRPWRTLQEVASAGLLSSVVRGGDTVYLRNGNHGTVNISGVRPASFISIEAESGHKPRVNSVAFANSSRLIFEGVTVTQRAKGAMVGVDASSNNIIVSRNEIYTAASTAGWTAADWSALGSRFDANSNMAVHTSGSCVTVVANSVRNVYFGIIVSGPDSIADGNTIQGFAGDGMRPGSSPRITLRRNRILDNYVVDDNHADGIQVFDLGTAAITDLTIDGNVIIQTATKGKPFDQYLEGIVLFDGLYERLKVINNVVIVDHWHGITVYGARNSIIANNTVAGSNKPWIQVANAKDGRASVNVVVRNNLSNSFDLGAGAVASNNITMGTNVGAYVLQYDLANRLFDMALKPGSPAIDAGSMVDTPNYDANNAPRSAPYDVGAYEFGASAPAPAPAPAPSPDTWTYCSDETGYCSFTGTMQVRFGAGDAYVTKTLTGGTSCTVSVFGDPIFGVRKHCDIAPVSAPAPAPAPAPDTNLLSNPGFESNLTGWTALGSGGSIISSGQRSGSKALRLSAAGQGQVQYWNLQSGATYRISGYAKVAATGDTVTFGYDLYGSNGANLNKSEWVLVNSTSYKLYTLDLTVPAGAAKARVFMFKNGGTRAVDFDDISVVLVKGGSAPAPTPTPTPTPSPAPTPTPEPAPTPVSGVPTSPNQVGYLGAESSLKPKSQVANIPGVSVSGPSIQVKSAGVVIDGYDLRGSGIEVYANNVTIRNCIIDGGNNYWAIIQMNGANGMTVENVTFTGDTSSMNTGEFINSDGVSYIRRNRMIRAKADNIKACGGVIEGNYIDGAGYSPGAHGDGFQMPKSCGPLKIQNNFIDLRIKPGMSVTSTLWLDGFAGPINGGVVIDNNVLLGAGYTVGLGAGDPMTFTNNRVGGGQYGYAYGLEHPITQYGNTDYFTGAAITLKLK